MKTRPIHLNDEMVRAILECRKTQTRRVVKLQHGADVVVTDGQVWRPSRTDYDGYASCPYGQPGDRLWVREAWMPDAPRNGEWSDVEFYGCAMSPLSLIPDHYRKPNHCLFRATWDGGELVGWKPSIHMPRWASRITLEITDIRCQRLQDISEEDAIAEGVVCPRLGTYGMKPETVFRDLWDSIAKPGEHWSDNPYVWAISFKRVGVQS